MNKTTPTRANVIVLMQILNLALGEESVGILAGNREAGKLLAMQSTDFYQQILGISSPWKIVNVDLDIDAKRVVIRAEVDRKTKWYHPDTQLPAALHKWTERTWRHLDTCQFETLIIAEVPSVKHKDGSIEEIAVPWAGRYQRHTKLLAQAVIMWLQARCNVSKVAEMMRLDWQPVNSIMKEGDDTLKNSKYQWLRNFPDLRSEPTFQSLYNANLETSKAWRFKESFSGFWDYIYTGAAVKFFENWCKQVNRSKLEPMKKVAQMLQNRLQGLLNYLKHRITNAASEGINSLVARIIANARGPVIVCRATLPRPVLPR